MGTAEKSVEGRGGGMWVEFELNSTIGEGFSVLLMQRDGRKEGVGRYWSERSFFGGAGRVVCIEGGSSERKRTRGVSRENKIKGRERDVLGR